MTCEVAVGHTQQLLQGVKISMIIHHECCHNTQAHPVVKKLIDICDQIFHQLFSIEIEIHQGAIHNVQNAESGHPKIQAMP